MMKFKRLCRWFDSFSVRLAAVITVGLTVMMGTNYATICAVQYLYVVQAEEDRARTIAAFTALFDNAAEEDRAALVRTLNAEHFNGPAQQIFTLTPSAPDWKGTDEEVLRQREILAGILSPEDPSEVNARLIDRISPLLEVHLPGVEFSVRLTDGTYLIVTVPSEVDDRLLVWPARIICILEGLLILAAILFLTRRTLTPINRLTQAVVHFGEFPENAPPVTATGTREVRSAASAFNQMRSRIQSQFAERSRIVSAMTHDLRTPLTKLTLRLDRVADETLRAQLQKNVRDMTDVINEGLAFVRSLQTQEAKTATDINALILSVADDYADLGEKVTADEALRTDAAVILSVRPLCLKRCLENLISNAVSYAGDAHIALSADAEGRTVITVTDHGPGIPEACLAHIFEPYYRVEGSRNRLFGGTGLGLTIAQNLATLNGAKLTLANRPAGGLEARITFFSA